MKKYTAQDIENQILEIVNKINDPELCKGTSETYSRISGYYRAINNWNTGKKGEYSERLSYHI